MLLAFEWTRPLTLADGSGPAGLRQAVTLAHRAAQAHVHEALRGGRQGSATGEQDSRVASQEGAHPFEHQTGGRGEHSVVR